MATFSYCAIAGTLAYGCDAQNFNSVLFSGNTISSSTLTYIGSWFFVYAAGSATIVSLPALRMVGGYLRIGQYGTGATIINLASLTYVGGSVQINGNTLLTSLVLPSLAMVLGGISICQNKAGLTVPSYIQYLGYFYKGCFGNAPPYYGCCDIANGNGATNYWQVACPAPP